MMSTGFPGYARSAWNRMGAVTLVGLLGVGCAADGRSDKGGGGASGGAGGGRAGNGGGGAGGGGAGGGGAGSGGSGGSEFRDGGSQTGGGDGGGSGGRSGAGGSAGSSGVDASAFTPDGKTCGEQTTPLAVSPRTPDVIIVFDDSSSMNQSFEGGTRYTTERDLLKPLVSQYERQIRWGFEKYPVKQGITMGCCAGAVCVSPGLNQAMAVNTAIDRNSAACNDVVQGVCPSGCVKACPNCGESCFIGTPTAPALRNANDFYANLKDGIAERYVLLSTDGEPNCVDPALSTDACQQSVAQVMALAKNGVKTIVLGISNEVANSQCLDALAQAGGAPRPGGPPFYYPANSKALLEMYLREIIGGIAKPTCFIDLTSSPPDPTKVAVFFDMKQVPYDPTRMNGWDYDPPGSAMRIRLFGSACTQVESFQVKELGVVFGCPPCGGTVSCEN